MSKSPFPGMDPYLEGPLWPMVHHNLIEQIARQLAPVLRPKYSTLTNQRIVVATPDASELPPTVRLPDVSVVTGKGEFSAATSATATAPLVVNAAIPERIEQTFVEIRSE